MPVRSGGRAGADAHSGAFRPSHSATVTTPSSRAAPVAPPLQPLSVRVRDMETMPRSGMTVTLMLAAAMRWPNLLVLVATVATVIAGDAALGPLAALLALCAGTGLFAGLVARDAWSPEFRRRVLGPLGAPHRPAVVPEQLEAIELSAAYADVLRAHDGLRVALLDSDGADDDLCKVYRRCTDLVVTTGRVARGADSLRRYLGSRSPLHVGAEASRLEGMSSRAGDALVAEAYRLAAHARRRQLELYQQIGNLYDRIEARLALVTAFLSTVEAMVVKLHARDLEQLHEAITSISHEVDELHGDVGLLESNLAHGSVQLVPDARSLAAGSAQ